MNAVFCQNISVEETEKGLDIYLPTDYLRFRGEQLEASSEIPFRIDIWTFWDLKTANAETIALRQKGMITKNDFAFAKNEYDQYLFYENPKKSSTKISLLSGESDIMFYAFSMSEFENYEITQELIESIDTVGFENQDLSKIKDCTGSLFQYAFELNTSEYDDNFSKERNKKALELFFATAEKGHPEAASEIASYYYFQENTDVEKVIEWREKAIQLGKKEERYELADFIIDEKVEEIDKAISLLESMLDDKWYKGRSMLKLSRLYMRGTGGKLDYEKGIAYAEACAKLENYNALSDLAYYYYKGMGVEKDIQKAYDLLVKAENKVKQKTGSGMWEEFIQQLETELKKEKK
jgi:TPR repeat protein